MITTNPHSSCGTKTHPNDDDARECHQPSGGRANKFLVDNSLFRVCKHLRLLGVDALWADQSNSYHLRYMARKMPDRILITRNKRMIQEVEQEKEQYEERLQKFKERQRLRQEQQQQRRRRRRRGQQSISLEQRQEEEEEHWKERADQEEETGNEMEDHLRAWMEMKRQKMNITKRDNYVPQVVEEEEDAQNFIDQSDGSSDSGSEMRQFDWEDDDDEQWEEEEPRPPFQYRYHFVKPRHWKDQIWEVVNSFQIAFDDETLFTRCLSCNSLTVLLKDKSQIKHRVYPSVYALYDRFYVCPGCEKLYWGKDSNEKEHVTYRHARSFAQSISWQGNTDEYRRTDRLMD